MKIKDFLENFQGTNHIKIFDKYDFSTHRYNNTVEAINDYGHYSVKSWDINNNNNVLMITIQSQF